jgi:flagellar basal-body rod modification protein FlgD
METNTVQPTAATAPAAGTGQNGAVDLADTFNDFLTLLTTQLQYQDPLSPLDSNQFTEQLVQFSSVEQAIKTNDKLDQLLAQQGNNLLTGALDTIGKSVEVEGAGLALSDGTADITYELAGNAAQTTIQIFDQSGRVVRTLTGATATGHHEVTWDGRNELGDALPDGLYAARVSALDAGGESIALTQGTIGRVTGIELADGDVLLTVGALQVPLSKVTSIREG